MILVDSSVWIDFFADARRPAVDVLSDLLESAEVRIVVPDLVLFEVLRGFRHERAHRQARKLLESLSVEAAGGVDLAMAATTHYRGLRAAGFTIRSAIDVLIATFCIERNYALLHGDRDRDFDFHAFGSLRGLQTWPHGTSSSRSDRLAPARTGGA